MWEEQMWVTCCKCLIDSSLISEERRAVGGRQRIALLVCDSHGFRAARPSWPQTGRQWSASKRPLERQHSEINKISFSATAFSQVSADSCRPRWFHTILGSVPRVLSEEHRNVQHDLITYISDSLYKCYSLLLTDCCFFRALFLGADKNRLRCFGKAYLLRRTETAKIKNQSIKRWFYKWING